MTAEHDCRKICSRLPIGVIPCQFMISRVARMIIAIVRPAGDRQVVAGAAAGRANVR